MIIEFRDSGKNRLCDIEIVVGIDMCDLEIVIRIDYVT